MAYNNSQPFPTTEDQNTEDIARCLEGVFRDGVDDINARNFGPDSRLFSNASRSWAGMSPSWTGVYYDQRVQKPAQMVALLEKFANDNPDSVARVTSTVTNVNEIKKGRASVQAEMETSGLVGWGEMKRFTIVEIEFCMARDGRWLMTAMNCMIGIDMGSLGA